MPIKDNKSNIDVFHIETFSLASGATATSSVIDTKNLNNGITFFLSIYSTDTITNTVSIDSFEDSVDQSVWNIVPVEKYIGDIENLQDLVISSNIGNVIGSIGLFSIDRYVRINYSADSGNTGVIGGSILANLGIEIKPGEL